MGLREQRAQRTRSAILVAALDLFSQLGFDQTTMEQIAATSEVGIATLYRYFPTKDSILLDPLSQTRGVLAAQLSTRPDDEPIAEALGNALLAYLAAFDGDAERWLRLRDLLDRAPGPRAGLWDVLAQERTLLEEAIAARAGASADELWVGIAAHTAMMIAEMSLDLRRSPVHPVPAADAARDIIRLLAADGTVVPSLPAALG
jgi:AcrR family transcriptional regulator